MRKMTPFAHIRQRRISLWLIVVILVAFFRQRRISHWLMAIIFLINAFGPLPVYALETQNFASLRLPTPGVMVHLSPQYTPAALKGLKVHADNPFRFDFILDKGDADLTEEAIKEESKKLIKYFLTTLTIPEKDLWVNLSPYEKNRIVPESFGVTEMGRDMLAQDYLLKQITASLIYPEDQIGKKFWKKVYEEAAKKYGTTHIPVNTFNKVWIMPDKAVVYENATVGTVYVVESSLKVMLEQDYLSMEKNTVGAQHAVPLHSDEKNINQLGSQIVREIIIPELTKEINEGMNFVKLRQVYHSLILAAWYKKKIKDSILSSVYADQNKVAGVSIDDPQEKEKIYQQYLKAFKKGVYNYIKEEPDPLTQEMIPRKYFSGGWVGRFDLAIQTVNSISSNALPQKGLIVVDAAMSVVGLSASDSDRTQEFVKGSRTIVLGGLEGEERKGGEMKEAFMGNVWITAGKNTYRVWIDDKNVAKFRRYSQKDGEARGAADKEMPMDTEFTVGRVEGDYVNSDPQLSSKHFSVKVTVEANGQSVIEVKDLKSFNGTTVEWVAPIQVPVADKQLSLFDSSDRDLVDNVALFSSDRFAQLGLMAAVSVDDKGTHWVMYGVMDANGRIYDVSNKGNNWDSDGVVKQLLSDGKLFKFSVGVVSSPIGRRNIEQFDANSFPAPDIAKKKLQASIERVNQIALEEDNAGRTRQVEVSEVVTNALAQFTDEQARLIIAIVEQIKLMEQENWSVLQIQEKEAEIIKILQSKQRPDLTQAIVKQYLLYRQVYEALQLDPVKRRSSVFYQARLKLASGLGVHTVEAREYFGSRVSVMNSLVASPTTLAAFQTIKDAAMVQQKKYGGIDFNTDKINLQIQGGNKSFAKGGPAFDWKADPALLQQLQNAPGFEPTIINIKTLPVGQSGVSDLQQFLGLNS